MSGPQKSPGADANGDCSLVLRNHYCSSYESLEFFAKSIISLAKPAQLTFALCNLIKEVSEFAEYP